MRTLRVNETKRTLGNAFIVNLFVLEGEKNLKKITKGSSSGTAGGVLTCLLTLRPRMPHICGFLDYFSFSPFLDYFSFRFKNLKLSSLNFALKSHGV